MGLTDLSKNKSMIDIQTISVSLESEHTSPPHDKKATKSVGKINKSPKIDVQNSDSIDLQEGEIAEPNQLHTRRKGRKPPARYIQKDKNEGFEVLGKRAEHSKIDHGNSKKKFKGGK